MELAVERLVGSISTVPSPLSPSPSDTCPPLLPVPGENKGAYQGKSRAPSPITDHVTLGSARRCFPSLNKARALISVKATGECHLEKHDNVSECLEMCMARITFCTTRCCPLSLKKTRALVSVEATRLSKQVAHSMHFQ